MTQRAQVCIEDNRCFLASLCLEQMWARVPELLHTGWSANAQFKVGASLHMRVSSSMKHLVVSNTPSSQGNGRAALHYAAGFGNVVVTQQLLDAPGTDVDVTDKAGMTPLHFAAQMGQRATTELLLQRRANPFMIVTRGIHKGRLAIDFASNSRAQDLNKALAVAMSSRSSSAVCRSRFLFFFFFFLFLFFLFFLFLFLFFFFFFFSRSWATAPAGHQQTYSPSSLQHSRRAGHVTPTPSNLPALKP